MTELNNHPQYNHQLGLLGYHVKWLQYGFLNVDELLTQIATFDQGVDSHKEHYRYAAFMQNLEQWCCSKLSEVASQTWVYHYLELVALDDDRMMATAAALALLKQDKLSEILVDEVIRTIQSVALSDLSSIIEQELALRKLRALNASSMGMDTLTVDEFNAYVAMDNGVVQAYLLDYFTKALASQSCEHTQVFLKTLATHGKNKRIRNLATQTLKKSQARRKC